MVCVFAESVNGLFGFSKLQVVWAADFFVGEDRSLFLILTSYISAFFTSPLSPPTVPRTPFQGKPKEVHSGSLGADGVSPVICCGVSLAQRMTRAVLSILVMFVCLAPMLEVNSTQDDHEKNKDVLESSINFLKEHWKFKMDALADELTEHSRIVDSMLDVLQNTGPEYSAAKKQLETTKEAFSELKAELLLNNEISELFWEFTQELFKDLDETEVNKDEL
ncbi:unnamed protein product [Arctogadus glacialis]